MARLPAVRLTNPMPGSLLPGAVRSAASAAAVANAAGKAGVRGNVVSGAPPSSGYYPNVHPTPSGAAIGVTFSPGSATVADVIARGQAQRLAAAEAGAAGLPEAIRADYIKRVTTPMLPSSQPGLVNVLQQQTERSRDTAEAGAQEAAAVGDARAAIAQTQSLATIISVAAAQADRAAAEAASAARAGDVLGARTALAKGMNARAKAAAAGRATIEATAKGSRAAATAGIINSLKTRPTAKGMDALNRFRGTRSNIAMPESLSAKNMPDPAGNGMMIETPDPFQPYVYDWHGLGALGSVGADDIARAAADQARAVRQVMRDVASTTATIGNETLRLISAATGTRGGFGALDYRSGSVMGAFGSLMGETGGHNILSQIMQYGKQAADTIKSIQSVGKPAPGAPAAPATVAPAENGMGSIVKYALAALGIGVIGGGAYLIARR